MRLFLRRWMSPAQGVAGIRSGENYLTTIPPVSTDGRPARLPFISRGMGLVTAGVNWPKPVARKCASRFTAGGPGFDEIDSLLTRFQPGKSKKKKSVKTSLCGLQGIRSTVSAERADDMTHVRNPGNEPPRHGNRLIIGNAFW